MRNGKFKVIGFIAFSALAGCAAMKPPVTPLGDDAYRLSVTGARYETQADTNLKALSAANNYCGTMGRQLMFRKSIETADYTWSPKKEDLTFVCADSKDPQYLQVGLKRDTAVVAQQ
jgi:hypothetical protein